MNKSGYSRGWSRLANAVYEVWVALFAGGVAAGIIIYLMVWSYQRYEEELVRMEQEQLTTIAETVSISLKGFVMQELRKLDLYFDTVEQDGKWQVLHSKKAADAFLNTDDQLYVAMACYNSEGERIYQRGAMKFDTRWTQAVSRAAICGKKLDEINKRYHMFLVRRCGTGENSVIIVYAMNLDRVYDKIVRPVRIGNGGYSVVKDESLSIIMHHVPDQIGMDAVYDRSVRYPNLDLSDLKEWIHMQQVQPVGSSVIRSYDWGDPDLRKEKRIVAYTTVRMPGDVWIVNSTLPFQELKSPLNRMLVRLAGIGTCLLVIVAVFVYGITKNLVRAADQKKEIAYLKEMNEGMELLCRKEEELWHYQRLQTLGEMSSHIAHEFNNYLTPIMVYGGMLETEPDLSGEGKKMIRGILGAAEQATDLSRWLLDFGRQEPGIAFHPIPMTECVKKASEMVAALVPDTITVNLHIDDREAWVRGRANMAEHILMNLCNNSFRAMEKGGSLTISYQTQIFLREGGKPGVLLKVEDTGCGISPELKSKIFEPFYTTKRSGKGTGLGLSVIKNIVTAAGGVLKVDSKVGEGAAFSIWFPQTEPEKEETRHIRGYRIMVVDDDKELLSALENSLTKKGYCVRCYSHPAAALSCLQKQAEDFDTLLTDYSMPVMNGLELLGLARRLNPKLRLLLMSGQCEETFEWHQKNGFFDEFLLKTDLAKKLDCAL